MPHILHDFLLVRGGAERLARTLAAGLDLPLYTGFMAPQLTKWAAGIKVNVLGQPIDGQLLRYVLTAKRFASIPTPALGEGDVIYSGVLAPFAVKNQKRGRRIHYCHSPPRFLYDLRDHYLSTMNPVEKAGFNMFCAAFRPRYEQAIRAMDLVIANSQNVANRLQHYLGIESIVIHPPIETERFQCIESGDYFVSLARLEDYKRVDMIVEAFKRLPDQKLVVVSGGSQEFHLRHLAAGYSNIAFTSWLDDERLADIIGRCRAAIYIPQDEDFGMSPLEAMAAGKPVIGVREGGLLESVLDEQTGILIPSPPQIEDLVGAITRLNAHQARNMQDACHKWAQRFSRELFIDRIKSRL